MSKESLEYKNLGIKVEDLRIILSETMRRNEISKEKLPKYCSDCNTELSFDNSSFSSQTKHTQIYLHCKKCKINWYFCFDENMNECDKLLWEH